MFLGYIKSIDFFICVVKDSESDYFTLLFCNKN